MHPICRKAFTTAALCLQIVPGFRVGIVPVLGTMPAIFGMAAASHILCHLAQQPFNPEPIMDITEQQYQTQMARLLEREETKYGDVDGVAVDYSDVSLFMSGAVPCPALNPPPPPSPAPAPPFLPRPPRCAHIWCPCPCLRASPPPFCVAKGKLLMAMSFS